MFNLCFSSIPSLFYIVLNDDYMLCKVTLGVLKGASKLNVLLLLLLYFLTIRRRHGPIGRRKGDSKGCDWSSNKIIPESLLRFDFAP